MSCCAIINCGNTNSKNRAGYRDISFHSFPKEPVFKNKWIEATGRKNWFPNKNSKICSIHFHEEDFTGPSKYRRVIKTAYPVIDIVKITNYEENTIEASTSDDDDIDDEIPEHTPKKKSLLRQLHNARQMLRQKDKQIKCLQEQNRRKIKKIHSLMTIIKSLKKKCLAHHKPYLNDSGMTSKTFIE